MPKERPPQDKASDLASIAMIEKAAADGAIDAFCRADAQGVTCRFGTDGVCCRMCHMGPCKITPRSPLGICGANADTIAARNLLREVAAGAAAHSDHCRHLVQLFKAVAEGRGGDYRIKDETRLRRAARSWGVDEVGLPALEVARQLAEVFTKEFSLQEGKVKTLELAPGPRQAIWDRLALAPRGIDATVVEALHRTVMGVDHDYRNLIHAALKTSLTDGWCGSMIATAIGDILFGTPKPVRSRANLGVLEAKKVNVLVHGHEPSLTEILAIAARDPQMLAAAKAVGAEGINLAGICCTANEVLMRHGVPVAGNFLQQELAIVTGAVEVMITDVQCCMASLPNVARCYHTKIITTSPIAKNVEAEAVEFDDSNALDCAKAILRKAIDNYPNRDPRKVAIPDAQSPMVAGFSNETIFSMLGGTFRKSFRPLNDAIISGRIRGIAGIVGCNNARDCTDAYITTLTKELIQRDIIVLQTGCAAIACGKQGLLTPEAALHLAGNGLREVCEAVGIPPVLHMGSCVDNSRILLAAKFVLDEGGLGNDFSELPAIGIAPEWMSEKAVAIGHYFVASGVDVILGRPFYTLGSQALTKYLCEDLQEIVGAKFHYISDVNQAIETVVEHIERKRDALGINRKLERKLYDMKDRRELNV
ncbi:MAG: anaerobic carbon-monoxide dehydrogenase catalytic subunit [Acidobacteria bacterium]|nr:anaerobic carbon-monoxide dehydrogenase catalytic subunit [Acidobacteriota bacterium]MBI3657155.1 anaerobic carbon-monoxide dehydrogenase catalytic subunit [Acidobacteriota bacterium]